MAAVHKGSSKTPQCKRSTKKVLNPLSPGSRTPGTVAFINNDEEERRQRRLDSHTRGVMSPCYSARPQSGWAYLVCIVYNCSKDTASLAVTNAFNWIGTLLGSMDFTRQAVPYLCTCTCTFAKEQETRYPALRSRDCGFRVPMLNLPLKHTVIYTLVHVCVHAIC